MPYDIDILDRSQSLQQQIFAELRAELLDGLWVGRQDFHTEKEVGERFEVSAITARAVLDRLADEGWIRRTRGRRAIPIRGPAEAGDPDDIPLVSGGKLDGFDYQVLQAGVGVAPAEACRAFGRPLGTQLWRCSRLRRLGGDAHSVTLNVQDPALGERHDREALTRLPMAALLHRAGEHVSNLRRQISAVSPPAAVAGTLGLKLGAATLLYTCTLHRRDDSLIEWLRVYVHPGRRRPTEAFDLDAGRWLHIAPP